jgi:hypothetical protein
MMVPQSSAIHAGKNEKSYDQIPIDLDHSDIAKFSNPSNPNYSIIESRIKRLVDEGPQIISKRTAGDRKSEITTLDEKLYVARLLTCD